MKRILCRLCILMYALLSVIPAKAQPTSYPYQETAHYEEKEVKNQPNSRSGVSGTKKSLTDTEKRLDIITWNIEWFGDEDHGPDDIALQLNHVKEVITTTSAAIYALQEISSDEQFTMLIEQLPDYEGVCSEKYAYYWEDGWPQKLCFIYKKDIIKKLQARTLFEALFEDLKDGFATLPGYPAEQDQFWASGRLPFLLQAEVNFEGTLDTLYLINIHAKANTGDQLKAYQRREYDIKVLKDSLDAHFSDKKVVVLGDYNDDMDVTIADIPETLSSYQLFLDDHTYQVITQSLTEAGERSTVKYDNMIDHITISNELYHQYMADYEEVIIPSEELVPDYAATTSDHYPVRASFNFGTQDIPLSLLHQKPAVPKFMIYPIPAHDILTVNIYDAQGTLALYTASGALLLRKEIIRQESLSLGGLARGLYMLRLSIGNDLYVSKLAIF